MDTNEFTMEDMRKSKRWQMKENKKHPYKKTRLSKNVNKTAKYHVVDTDGNVVGKYRLKQTCLQEHGSKCKIIDQSKI